ncbi:hypothetical protein ACOSQ3_027881 [Xanthoceras sorbifolium]
MDWLSIFFEVKSSLFIRVRNDFHSSLHLKVQANGTLLSLGSRKNKAKGTFRPESSLSWVLRIAVAAAGEEPTMTS